MKLDPGLDGTRLPHRGPVAVQAGDPAGLAELGLVCFGVVLWMDEILHHLRQPGMMIPLQIPANNGFPWFVHPQ